MDPDPSTKHTNRGKPWFQLFCDFLILVINEDGSGTLVPTYIYHDICLLLSQYHINFVTISVSDPYSFFPDPDPEVEAGDQYGSGSGSNTGPGL
jgi:hypothetical protein